MKIEQAEVALGASHHFSSECTLRIESESSFRTIFAGVSQADPAGAAATPVGAARNGAAASARAEALIQLETLIARMLDFILGHRESSVSDLREILRTEAPSVGESSAGSAARETVMEWTTRTAEKQHESERSEFTSTGKVQTSDGRILDFQLDLTLARDYQTQRTSSRYEKVVLRDPLVINFSGTAAEFSGKKFAFDLNADGQDENLPALIDGCGYLAIDNNCDGRINDGSELFGTRSGNGFADLAKLDADGNFWIDEADPAFAKLRIWQFDVAGQSQLSTLREQNVGALYVGSVETPFSLTDDENRLLAQIRASGVYLADDGRAGALQQIDLAV